MDRQQPDSDAACRSMTTGINTSRSRGRRWLPLLLVAGMLFSAAGCQIVIGVLMILRELPKDDSDFRKATNNKYNIEDSKKKVVVLCTSPEEAKQDNVAINQDLIEQVSRQMKANGINVIEPHEILTWIDDHGGVLRESDLAEIGKKFDVDFLIQIRLEAFSIRDRSSPGLYHGNAVGRVRVWARDGQAEKKVADAKSKDKAKSSKGDNWTPPALRQIYMRPYKCMFPSLQPVPAGNESPLVFCKRFEERVGKEIALLFYDHRLKDEM